jgi:hypothetical protein
MCKLKNIETNKISNHELCIYKDTCEDNNVEQYTYLNLRIFGNKNTREIYKMIGQENIYDQLISKIDIDNIDLFFH